MRLQMNNMSDKGMEGVEFIYDAMAQEIHITVDDIKRYLRSYGWLHEDDVVEGRTVKQYIPCPKCKLMHPGDPSCNQCGGYEAYQEERPATVKDLIG